MASGMRAFYQDCKQQLKTKIEEFEESIVKEIMAQTKQLRCAIDDAAALSLHIDSQSVLTRDEVMKKLIFKGLSENEAKVLVRAADIDKDGGISAEEMQNMFRISEKEAKDIVNVLDMNHDGILSAEEMQDQHSEVCLCVFMLQGGAFVCKIKLHGFGCI